LSRTRVTTARRRTALLGLVPTGNHEHVAHSRVDADHGMCPVGTHARWAAQDPPGLHRERAVPAPPIEGRRGGQDPRLPGGDLVQQRRGGLWTAPDKPLHPDLPGRESGRSAAAWRPFRRPPL